MFSSTDATAGSGKLALFDIDGNAIASSEFPSSVSPDALEKRLVIGYLSVSSDTDMEVTVFCDVAANNTPVAGDTLFNTFILAKNHTDVHTDADVMIASNVNTLPSVKASATGNIRISGSGFLVNA